MWAGGGVAPEDRIDRAQARNVGRRILSDARDHRPQMYGAFGFVTLSVLCTLAGPLLVRAGIDHGIRRGNGRALNIAVIGYVLVVCFNYVVSRQQFVFVNRAGEGFLRDLRVRVFRHLMRQSMAFFDREKAGVLVARMTADIEAMAEIVQWGLLQFLSASLLIVLAIALLATLSWQLTLVVLIVFPVIIIASIKFQRDANAAYLVVRERVGNVLSSLQEGLSGVRVIQGYARETEQIRRFHASNASLFAAHRHSVKVSTWYFGLIELAGMIGTALIVGVGGWMVHDGRVSLGTVTAFVLLLSSLFEPVQMLSQMYNSMQSAAAALHKLYALIDTEPDVVEADDAVDLPADASIEVRDLGFSYATGKQVLSGVSLSVPPGQRLALVGPTGAGKSTLAKLIARMYDPTSGSITYGGVDLRQISTQSLRTGIAVVPQEGFLFGGTIRDNVRLAKPTATDAEVDAAVKRIGAWDHFERFDDGLDTEVRERGSRLSAGERQLVSLARAALVDPAVLVLDEATSNLDPGTEAEVEAAMEHLMNERTVIVVAHRLSTVRRADRIGVVDGGELTEYGTHDDLMAMDRGRYRALAEAWARSQPAVTDAQETDTEALAD